MDATQARAHWAATNGISQDQVDDYPLAAFAPLAAWEDDLVHEAAARALRRDGPGKLRPIAWREEAERLGTALRNQGRCQHHLLPGTCPTCPAKAPQAAPAKRRTASGTPSKAESVTELCRLLGVPDMGIGVGSSIYSDLFRLMATRTGVSPGSMPEIGEAIASKAGIPWDLACDSRATPSEGGSTVTGVGLARLVPALRRLL